MFRAFCFFCLFHLPLLLLPEGNLLPDGVHDDVKGPCPVVRIPHGNVIFVSLPSVPVPDTNEFLLLSLVLEEDLSLGVLVEYDWIPWDLGAGLFLPAFEAAMGAVRVGQRKTG